MNENKAKTWRCASCSFVGMVTELKPKNFGKLGKSKVCPECDTEDIFPAFDGLWPTKEELNAQQRDVWDYDD